MEDATTNAQVSNDTTQEADSLKAYMEKGKELAKKNPIPAG